MTTDAPLSLRPAGPEDADLLLRWRNDPTVRANSRNRGEVKPAEHEAWLAATLADTDRELLVLQWGDDPVGQVRLDALGEGRYEISISLDPAARGRGLAARAIAMAAEGLETEGEVEEIEAWVRPDNEASLAAFRSAGFADTGRTEDGLSLLVRSVR